MKKTIYLLSFISIIITHKAIAQIDDGRYKFESKEYKLEFTIIGDGWKISEANLYNALKNTISSGKGEYREANGAGWYEFQTTECNYSFEIPKDKLILEQYDCKNGQKALKSTLLKKKVEAEVLGD